MEAVTATKMSKTKSKTRSHEASNASKAPTASTASTASKQRKKKNKMMIKGIGGAVGGLAILLLTLGALAIIKRKKKIIKPEEPIARIPEEEMPSPKLQGIYDKLRNVIDIPVKDGSPLPLVASKYGALKAVQTVYPQVFTKLFKDELVHVEGLIKSFEAFMPGKYKATMSLGNLKFCVNAAEQYFARGQIKNEIPLMEAAKKELANTHLINLEFPGKEDVEEMKRLSKIVESRMFDYSLKEKAAQSAGSATDGKKKN